MHPAVVPSLHSANPWHLHMSVIDEIRDEIEETRTFTLRFLEPELAQQYRFAAGQFNMLYVPGCGEVAISLSGHTGGDGRAMVHTIRQVGRVTEALFQLKVGDRVGVRGPYGSRWPSSELEQHDVVFVAGGLGLAPLRPLLYEVMDQPERYSRLILQLGARQPDLFLYTDEFEVWRSRGLEIQQIVDRPSANWTGPVGLVPSLLENLADFNPERTVVVTCGPEIMMRFVAQQALKRGVPSESIWCSLERNMQCAVGLCGHCQLGPMFVCRQGPVFRYDQVATLLSHPDL